MMREPGEDQQSSKVLEFPATGQDSPESRRRKLLSAVRGELSSVLRDSPLRIGIRSRLGVSDEKIDGVLRAPELRACLAAGVQAFATEKLPAAIKAFYSALEEGENWAYRILLDAIGFAGLAGGALEPEVSERPEVTISDAFERDIVERMLRRMRGVPEGRPEPAAEE